MLVSPTSSLQKRHRQHRRENSIPVALEATKTPNLPAPAMKRYQSHGRGLSWDLRASKMQSGQLPRGNGGSIMYNDGYPQQHNVLRETQQPLLRQHQAYLDHAKSQMSSNAEYQTFGPSGLKLYTNLPSNENFPTNACMGLETFGTANANNTAVHLNQAHGHVQQQHYLRTAALTGPIGQLYDQEELNTYLLGRSGLPQLHPDKTPIPDNFRRGSVQSHLGQSFRPSTPPRQMNSTYFPITPETTPFRRHAELAKYNQNVHCSPTKNATVYQTPESAYMQRANSLQGVLGSTFTQPKIDVPSPPNTAPVDYDTFDILNIQDSDFESSEFQGLPESKSIRSLSTNGAQNHSQSSPESSSFQSSPELADMPLPTDTAGKTPRVPICPSTPSRQSTQNFASSTSGSSPSKAKLSPRVPTIDSLNLDSRVQASIAETGITPDEIASFISGPDPEDGKWVCLHTGCNRRFGRKENIKSHIQTHLGDRQFKCDHCEKCFVRGHDLKRHAKIHTGDKPYECLCGNVFARHDALTRHRQRGMCIGGYKGVIRKTTKRGRPKKSRPDMEDRHDKALRTREKVAARSDASPMSGYDSSSASQPSEDFENMSIRVSRSSSPANDMAMFENDPYCMPTEVFTFTPPASPGHSTGHKPSPSASHHSYSSFDAGSMSRTSSKQSLERIPEELADLPPISEAAGCFDPEPRTINSSVAALSSPPTVPALTASSIESDYDIFLNQDPMTTFEKNEFSSFNKSPFSDFGADSGLTNDLDLFEGKLRGQSSNDEVFLEFTEDQQQSEVFFR